jgi:hypothetical protein
MLPDCTPTFLSIRLASVRRRHRTTAIAGHDRPDFRATDARHSFQRATPLFAALGLSPHFRFGLDFGVESPVQTGFAPSPAARALSRHHDFSSTWWYVTNDPKALQAAAQSFLRFHKKGGP